MIRPSGPAPARIMIVGEAPGEQEMLKGIPFVGASGQELERMLKEAGIYMSQCFLTTVCRVRPPGNDITAFIAQKKSEITPAHQILRDKYVLAPIWEGLELLKREIELVQPNVIIALGNVSMWALTGKWGITSWRGSMLQSDLKLSLDYAPKVIPAYHPAAVLRQWNWRPMAVQDLRRAKSMSAVRELVRPDYSFIIRPDYATAHTTLSMLLARAEQGPLNLGNDIETRAGQIACIALAWSKTQAICIPLMCSERAAGYWTLEEEIQLSYLLFKLLTHPNCRSIGQNFIYDAQYYNRWLAFIPNVLRDTMLSQHSMFSNMPKGLDVLSSMYCAYHAYWKDDGKLWDAHTGEDQLWYYNCEDAVRTFEVDEGQQTALTAMGLNPVNDFQQSLFAPVLQTMNRGIRVNKAKRSALALQLMGEISEREAWIHNVLGRELNIRSGPQMKDLFYGELGEKEILHRGTGSVTLNDEALARIAARNPLLGPIVRKIQELRSLGVFLSTFITASLDSDGRLRCSFNIGGTVTYRFSSSQNAFGSGLNLQNIPAGGAMETGGLTLPNVKELFIPDPGMTFFDIDLSQADLRIVTWEADEPEMKSMLRAGLDPYTEIAKEFYSDPTITKQHPKRQTFKSFAHGTHYLGSARELAERLGLSVHIAEKTQKWYFQRFPRIKKWQDDLKDQVLKRRMVENVFGYRCYIFDRIEGTVFNQAAAWIPQSTVGCLINRAYRRIYDDHKDVQVLLQVHDSLAGQFPSHAGDEAKRRIVKAAEIVLPYDDPLVIPVGVKTSNESWGDCK